MPWETFSDEEKRRIAHEALIALNPAEKLPTEAQLNRAFESLIKYKVDQICKKFDDVLANKIITHEVEKYLSEISETANTIGQAYIRRYVLQKMKKYLDAASLKAEKGDDPSFKYLMSFVDGSGVAGKTKDTKKPKEKLKPMEDSK